MAKTVAPSPMRMQPSLMGRKDLVEASRAVHDAVQSDVRALESRLPDLVKEAVSVEMEGVEHALAHNITRALERDFESRLTVRLTKILAVEVEQHVQQATSILGVVKERLSEAERDIATLRSYIDTRFAAMEDRVVATHAAYDQGLKVLAEGYGAGQDRLVEAIKAMPVPEVYVPSDAIRVQQSTPNVMLPDGAIRVDVHQSTPVVNLPMDAIRVQVDQLPSIVHLPESAIHVDVHQSTPVVNLPKNAIRVQVDQKPSIVNLPPDAIRVESHTVMERHKGKTVTKKDIVYDKTTMLPASIVEETTEE